MKRTKARAGWLLVLAGAAAPPASGADDPTRARLVSRDVDVVYAALEEVEARKDRTALEPLVEAATTTAYPHVAVACGDVARSLGSDALGDAGFGAAVARAAKARDARRLANAARFVAALREPRFDDVLAGLVGAKDAAVEIEALQSCAGMGPVDPKAFPKTCAAVGAALAGANEEVRAVACAAAGRMRLAAEADTLVRIACAATGMLDAAFAAVACRRLDLSGRLPAVRRALAGAQHAQQLRPVLRTIVMLGRGDDPRSLTELARSPKDDVREAAARAVALERAPDGRGTPAPELDAAWDELARREVDDSIDDASWSVRDAARAAARRLGERTRPFVAARVPAAFRGPSTEAAAAAIEMAAALGMKDQLDELRAIATGHEDAVRRMLAARAMGRIAAPDAAARLAALVRPSGKASPQALAAVRALGYVRARESLDVLVGLLETTGFPTEVREEAETALERLTGRRLGRSEARWKAWIGSAKDPFAPRLGRFDRAQARRDATRGAAADAPADAERAIERALRWLEAEQHALGEWEGAEKGYGGRPQSACLETGIAALAYLGAGYRVGTGRFRETVRRAVDYLAALETFDGSFPSGPIDASAHEALQSSLSFLLPWAAGALVEATVLGEDAATRACAQRAVDGLVRAQTLGASWATVPRASDVDTAPAAWAGPALAVARAGGLDVEERAFDGIDAWLEACSTDVAGQAEPERDEPDDASAKARGFAYTLAARMPPREQRDAGPRTEPSLTEMGMVLRLIEGWPRSHPFLAGGARLLASRPPDWDEGALVDKGPRIGWRSSYWGFGLLALHATGGSRWRTWSERVRRFLDEHQRTEPDALAGSWDPDLRHSHDEGRIEATAKDVLALEAPYRFPLPLPR